MLNVPTHALPQTPGRGRVSLLAIAGAVLLTGCSTLAPDYTRTALPLADDWRAELAAQNATPASVQSSSQSSQGLSSELATQLPWQNFIKDPRLAELIELALSNNRSLQQTLADVEAARATYRIQRADLFPNLDVGLNGNRSRLASGVKETNYQAELGLSGYEIDLFGKNRSLSAAQMEAYLATAATAKAAHIALISEVANAWLTLAADNSALTLAQETMANAEKTLAITRKRLELGVDSQVDVASAETVYHRARADIALYTSQVAQDTNALRLLVGEQLNERLLATALPSSATLVSDVPAGLSSEVLLQRPDVLAVEHSLKSAHANIGVARAAYLPSLSLTANGGVASSVLADIFSGGASTIWAISPSITLPIFDGGANSANLAYSKAQQRKALAAYEYAIQSAFAEVADALARRATIQEQLDAEQALVAAASRSYSLSLARYQNGVDSFQTALEAQRTMYSAQQSLILTRQADLDNRITLYRVLGGGLAAHNSEQGEG
ncbi:efflux transporter outer membrane subunit [Dasania sp. GY-MA-18]|uniref:Efflux transporter outer membrane subunit n=1 Tax=Dasania phycosphaerae TaxID=2950436 RepID=A0A9J6RPL8_9GAMM|nr:MULTISPECIES: efflux transporter outer membrane subunit [Dasania]MCR8923815.1 efflux transporter outer membrane subunit [Dasania sp. GY-MA-18]MCZ0866249.1 efflux transporter outer membrane subunit [Dasania phycosphaerae]MCZ0869973.1 efflux transporter outer membrane subunit [Dasania phycosphaerae]